MFITTQAKHCVYITSTTMLLLFHRVIIKIDTLGLSVTMLKTIIKWIWFLQCVEPDKYQHTSPWGSDLKTYLQDYYYYRSSVLRCKSWRYSLEFFPEKQNLFQQKNIKQYYMLYYLDQHTYIGCYIHNDSNIVLCCLLQISVFAVNNLEISCWTLYSIHMSRLFLFCFPCWRPKHSHKNIKKLFFHHSWNQIYLKKK